MKLLMIVVDSDHKDDVEKILDTEAHAGYSEVPTVLGKGRTGKKKGNRAFPGSSTLFFTAIEGETCEGLCDELKALRNEVGPEEGLRVFTLEAEMVL